VRKGVFNSFVEIHLYLKRITDMGRVAQYRHIISLHISDRQRETLRCLSRRLQMPMSELIRRAIDEFIEKYKDCEGETWPR
jgi:hypothetical protein